MKNQLPDARARPLTLNDMLSAFILLGLGISLAILVYLLELIYKRINDHFFAVHINNKPIQTRPLRTLNGQEKKSLSANRKQLNSYIPDRIPVVESNKVVSSVNQIRNNIRAVNLDEITEI